jgi:hypothetical protein
MRIMRWLTGVAAWAFGRGPGQAGDDGCPCFDCRERRGRSFSETAYEALHRAAAECDAMRAADDAAPARPVVYRCGPPGATMGCL